MVEAPVRERRFRRATVRTALLAGGVGLLVLAIAVAAWTLYSRHQAQAQARAKEAHERTAAMLAERAGRAWAPVMEALAAAARDPQVVAALKDGDAARRARVGASLKARFRGALAARLLPADTRDVDPSSRPPLSFAAVAMLGELARGAPPRAEVHLAGTPDRHVALAAPVRDEAGDLVGFVWIALDPAELEAVVRSLELPGGYVELVQTVPGSGSVVIAGSGDAGARSAGAPALAPVPGTGWQLRYYGRAYAGSGMAPTGAGRAWWVIAALLLAALAVGVWAWRRRRGAPAGEVTYAGAVKAIIDGLYPGLERLVPGLEARASAGAETSPAGDGPRAAMAADGDGTTVQSGLPEPLDITAEPATADGPAEEAPATATEVPAVIFRAYDIRGVVEEALTPEVVYEIGRALGTEAYERGQQGLVVGRDGRASSPDLAVALIEGLRDTGRDVIDVGLVPTPVLYFATHYLDTGSGVMVTGSHNPPEYNGLKIVLGGETLSGEAIQAIRSRIERRAFMEGNGTVQQAEIIPEYVRRISEDIPAALGNPLKIAVDCGNGAAGVVAPQLLRALGHDVVELYCEVDGSFPNHHPDPSQPQNLADLIDMVRLEQADLGVAFDGDADRLGVVDGAGNIIWPDRQLMLFARDVLSRNPGATIIFDVKCSGRLAQVIREAGGVPLMWRTGHSLIKAKMKEVGAPLAGEMSGHIFFKERWYGFDDGIYAAARLTEILVNDGRPPSEVFAELPSGVATPELKIPLPEERHAEVIEALIAAADFPDGEVTTVDGLRVDFPDGWGLVRASNTTPCLVLRFEGDDEQALERVRQRFQELLRRVDPSLEIPT